MITETLQHWNDELRATRQAYECELERLPKGSLWCSHDKKGYAHYIHAYDDEAGEPVREGIGRNKALMRRLARKMYLYKAIKMLDADIVLLERLLAKWQPCSPQAIIDSLPTSLRDVPQDYFLNRRADSAFYKLSADAKERIASHLSWGEQEYARSPYLPEGLQVTTSSGLKVRSKAESLIAEKLYEYGIPFRYEQCISVAGSVLVPDFTFQAADGSEFYLEFCGMMDNYEYVEGYYKKRQQYEVADIVPWRNIMYLYEAGNVLDMQQVKAVIETWIIPKL